jgi:uncharacterized protein YbjT (DUF2867 family)
MENKNNKTAIVFGATGLVGSYVVKELLDHPAYHKVLIFVRQSSGITHEKLTETVIDFTQLDNYAGLMKGDDVFSCFGTTKAQTPDKKQYYIADVVNVIKTAEICKGNGASGLAVVSSIGASATSGNNYLKLKGEMEEGIKKLAYEKLAIVRPSFLLGKRKKVRIHEEPARWIMQFFGLFMFGKAKGFKAIHAQTVARAMIRILNEDMGAQQIFLSGELQRLGKI